MKNKTKALKKGNYIPGSATPAPATKAEKVTNTTSTNHITRDKKKEIEQRARTRRINSLIKRGIAKEQIEEWMHEEDNRFILCLVYNSFSVVAGTKEKKVYHRDEHHRVTGVSTEEVENRLWGIEALKKFCEDNNLIMMSTHKGSYGHAGWILTDKEHVDSVTELLKPVGRVSITKPEPHVEPKPKKEKKPSNNTPEAKAAAKARRKGNNMKKASMRAYYAALRKGGVSDRIKKHNKPLAEKIEKWIKEKKAVEASRVKGSKEERAKHRQLTSLEMKANKRARKAKKFLATQERRKEREKLNAERNAKMREKHAQKPSKPVQTELKVAA